jgi:hypothetical protein
LNRIRSLREEGTNVVFLIIHRMTGKTHIFLDVEMLYWWIRGLELEAEN